MASLQKNLPLLQKRSLLRSSSLLAWSLRRLLYIAIKNAQRFLALRASSCLLALRALIIKQLMVDLYFKSVIS